MLCTTWISNKHNHIPVHKLSTYPQLVIGKLWIMFITNLKYCPYPLLDVYKVVRLWITRTFVRSYIHKLFFILSTTVDIF